MSIQNDFNSMFSSILQAKTMGEGVKTMKTLRERLDQIEQDRTKFTQQANSGQVPMENDMKEIGTNYMDMDNDTGENDGKVAKNGQEAAMSTGEEVK